METATRLSPVAGSAPRHDAKGNELFVQWFSWALNVLLWTHFSNTFPTVRAGCRPRGFSWDEILTGSRSGPAVQATCVQPAVHGGQKGAVTVWRPLSIRAKLASPISKPRQIRKTLQRALFSMPVAASFLFRSESRLSVTSALPMATVVHPVRNGSEASSSKKFRATVQFSHNPSSCQSSCSLADSAALNQ